MKNYQRFLYFLLSTALLSVIILLGRKDFSVTYTTEDLDIHESQTTAYTPGILLRKGDYHIHVFYAADVDIRMDFFGTADDNYIATLPANMYGGNYEADYSLSKDAQGAKLRFEVPQGGIFYVAEIIISSERPLYTDALFFAVLTACLLIFLFFVLEKKWYRRLSAEQVVAFLMMFFAVVIAVSPHFSPYLYYGNDLGGQLIRIEGVKDAILDRQFPVVLFPRTVNEYGELGVMYPYLFLIFPAVLRICRVSLLTAYNVTIFCTAAAVVSVMYYALRTLQVSSLCAALSAALYLLSPSFIHAETDNGAVLGNGISYIFIPLVIAGLLHLLQGNGNRWPLLTIGFTGLLQSHLVTTLLVLVCAVLLLCILIPVQLARGRGRMAADCIPDFLKAGIWCLMINIWWIVPFLYYYRNGNLYLGALGEGFWTFDLQSFVSYESGQYAIILCIWLIVMIAIAFSSKKISENVYFAAALFLVGLVLTAACTMLFPWDMLRRLSFFRFFSNTMQFPYRFFFAAFAFLIFGIGMLADRIRMWLEKKQKFLPYCIAMLFILLPVLLYDSHIMKEYSSPDRISYTVITGDIAPYKQREYLPLGTEDEYFSGRDYRLSDENAVRITDYQKRGDKADFVYYYIEGNERKEEYIELPLFLYPGYQIRLSEGAITLPAESGKENHMRIYLPFSETEKKVEVFFVVNPVFTFLTVFSALAFVAMLFTIKKDRERVRRREEIK